MSIQTTKAVFQFGKEYTCINFYDDVFKTSGVKVILDDEELGKIVGVTIPEDIDDVDANVAFDNEVIAWIVDNDK